VKVPLVAIIHGGPRRTTRTAGSRATRSRAAARAEGYAVFYPNYRAAPAAASPSRRPPSATRSQGVRRRARRDRLPRGAGGGRSGEGRITGGSYGGYFTAWGATKHSSRFAAGVMFVGISDTLFKARTTDIPREDEMVHMGTTRPRTPVLRRAQPDHLRGNAKTPLLILHGKEDPRVDPSQSRMLYGRSRRRGTFRCGWSGIPARGTATATPRRATTTRCG